MRYQSTIAPRRNRLSWILPMVVFVALLVLLYSIKAQTLAVKARVNVLEQTLVHERQVVQMLAAEIAHLESPERLRDLAVEQLELESTPVSRTLTLAEAAAIIPKKPKKVADAVVGYTGGEQ